MPEYRLQIFCQTILSPLDKSETPTMATPIAGIIRLEATLIPFQNNPIFLTLSGYREGVKGSLPGTVKGSAIE